MTTYTDGSSDQDMLSQTENDDTDTGEVSTVSDTSITQTSSATESSLELKEEKPPSATHQRPKLCVNISADLTDVTDLEDNASNTDDNAQNKEVKNSQNNADTKTGASNMFSMSANWYNQKCFENYWNHYNQVMSWCSKHFQVYSNLTNKTSSKMSSVPSQMFDNHYRTSQLGVNSAFPYYPYTMHHPYVNPKSSSNSVSKSKKSKRRRKAKAQQKMKIESCSEGTVTETETEASEVIEMEVTQDMIDFYAKTMEHRINREKEKKAEALEASTQPEHINVEDVKITDNRTPTVEAPKERPGARRTAEMKLLYGKGAAMIHGMETALQMTFDRNLDIKEPKMWPNMPLRVVFG